MFGFRNGSRYEENLQELKEFLDDPPVRLLPITWNTAALFGQISAALRRQGRPIPTNDVWIAAHAIEADASLISSDQHFRGIEGLSWLSFTPG